MVRWVISPLVPYELVYDDGAIERGIDTAFALYVDPATGLRYAKSSILDEVNMRALSAVRGVDFTPIDRDSRCINVLRRDYAEGGAILRITPRADGWNQTRVNQTLAALQAEGIDVTGLGRDVLFSEWITRIGDHFHPGFVLASFANI